jgi:hypothetical protein
MMARMAMGKFHRQNIMGKRQDDVAHKHPGSDTSGACEQSALRPSTDCVNCAEPASLITTLEVGVLNEQGRKIEIADEISNAKTKHAENNVERLDGDRLSMIVQILKNVDWGRFSRLCSSLGSELNDHQWRFLKALFLENAVSQYSGGTLTYIGEKGRDFVVPSMNVTIEMKYTSEALYAGKKTVMRENTKEITLMNSKGTNTHVNLPDTYADYLLIVEQRGAAIISKENLKKYVEAKGDSLTAKIPTSELTVISQPTDGVVVGGTDITNLKIKDKFGEIIMDIINSAR